MITKGIRALTNKFFSPKEASVYINNYTLSINELVTLGLKKKDIVACRKAWVKYTKDNPPKGYVEVPNYPYYLINKKGNIINVKRNPIAKYKDSSGYIKANLSHYNKDVFIHVILAKLFIPNPNGLAIVNHKDGDKSNYSLPNLEWVTQQDNIKHAVKTKLFTPNVEGNGMAKLTDKQVKEIYDSKDKTAELVDRYKVSKTSIKDIRAGRKWRSVTQGD